ncbi:methyltransferase domain-containing protein [Candidatus Pelagibacter sp. HIMB1709]|uniref:methyltransferase domain-containing protein n=1 Tax=Candidatus Pelagibacter sp. HIMB1709 TaxID=3413367 RepID=UPI003F8256C1
MVEFNKTYNCKICNREGISFYNEQFLGPRLTKYFTGYYGEEKFKLFKNKLEGINFHLLRCDNCKFIWQKNSPDNKFSYLLYDNIIDSDKSLEKSKLKFVKDKFRVFEEINLLFHKFKKQKINILDFGAGWGHWLISGDKKKYNPYAFELSNKRKNFLKKMEINIIDFDNINNYENYFHFIRLDQVLEHLDNFNYIFKILKKVARKDCIFFISVPDGSNLPKDPSKIKIQKGPIQPLEHLNCFSRFSLEKLILRENFQIMGLKETIMMHFHHLLNGKVNISLFYNDVKHYFNSTSIKFKFK